MADPHVVTALRTKRAELAGEIAATEQRVRELRRDLEHIDASLTLFAPDEMPELIRPKEYRPKSDWAGYGENARRILDILRRANGEPLTTRDIAVQIMSERGLDMERPKFAREMTRRISYTLRRQRDRGVVVSESGGLGVWLVWRLAS
jgi:hypothetical protein